MFRPRISILTGLLCLVLAFSNCQNGAKGKKEVKIGAVLDLTGPAASFGQMQRQGIELAVAQINAAPRCGYSVVPIIEDSRLDAKAAIAAASKLAQRDRIAAVVSITGSSMALTTAPVFNQAKIPVLDSLSSAASLSIEGGAYYFRIQPSDNFAGAYLIQWARENPAFKRAAVVYAESDWGQGLRNAISTAAQENGLQIVALESAKQGETDFRATILRIRQLKPDLLFVLAHPQEAGLLIRQLSEIGYKIPIMGSDSLSTDEVRTAAGTSLDGAMFCLSSPGEGQAYDNLQREFQMRYGTQATVNSTKPYETVMIIYEAVCRTGPDPESIRASLEQMNGYVSVGGPIRFDKNGDIIDPKYDRFVYRGSTFTKMAAVPATSALTH